MQLAKTFFSIALSASLLFACSGNTATNEPAAVTGTTATSSSSSGKDTYYEYTITSGSKELSMNGGNKMYISSKGDMRVEQNLTQVFGGKTNLVSIVSIGKADKPGETIVLNSEDKTYSINKVDTADMDANANIKSSAVKMGDEKILGFNCVHARVTSDEGAGSIAAETFDIWKSNDVPVLPYVLTMMNQFESKSGNMYSAATVEQLKQMGCDGFLVQMIMNNKEASFKMQLVKVEHRDIPASLFEIPAGYTEDKSGM